MFYLHPNTENNIILPILNSDCVFVDGEYTLTFEECDDQEFTFGGLVCGRNLNLFIEHECDNRSGFNLDVGTYRVFVDQLDVIVGVYKFHIYPQYSNL